MERISKAGITLALAFVSSIILLCVFVANLYFPSLTLYYYVLRYFSLYEYLLYVGIYTVIVHLIVLYTSNLSVTETSLFEESGKA